MKRWLQTFVVTYLLLSMLQPARSSEMNLSDKINNFWRYFVEHKSEIANISYADDPAYRSLLAKLQLINQDLFIELGAKYKEYDLIVTAGGNPDLFDLVDTIVSQAPVIEGWTIYALKPKLGFPKTTYFEGFEINPSELVFEPLRLRGSGELGIRVFIPKLDPVDVDRAYTAVSLAIDHGLGERRFAEEIKHLEVRRLPEAQGPKYYIPLIALDTFIEQTKKKREDDIRKENETAWYTGVVQYEGYPLVLRFPEKPNYEILKNKYPKLVVIKQALAKVRDTGLPDPDYNKTLFDFDEDIVTLFSKELRGMTVLVETFGGSRTYYIYVSESVKTDEYKKKISEKYPEHDLKWQVKSDKNWDFIRKYSKEFKLYKD